MALPTGPAVTFLFTDIEGSTRLERAAGSAAWAGIVARHDALVRAAIDATGGAVVKTEGDAVFAAFGRPDAAVAAAVAAQRALAAEPWPGGIVIRVRMGLHLGEGRLRIGSDGEVQDYVGIDVNYTARIATAGNGGQVILSDRLVTEIGQLAGTELVDEGLRAVKDFEEPARLHRLVVPGAADDPRSLRTLDAPSNLPADVTALIGRDAEIEALADALTTSRIVTLTGPGGSGKTRLAIGVARSVVDRFAHGTWFVDLAAVRDPSLLEPAVATAMGVMASAGQSVGEALRSRIRDRTMLILLDNLEQLLPDGASIVGSLARDAAGIRLLVTSRELLRIGGERGYPAPPLDLEAAVALFEDRARTHRPDLELTDDSRRAIREIAERLGGLPLAIELAAARVRLMSPTQIRDQVGRSLDLAGGARDAPERQRTLRGAIAWSHDLLTDDERRLFRRLAVFAGGWTLDALAALADDDAADAAHDAVDPALADGLASLTDKSLVRIEPHDAGANGRDDTVRFGMHPLLREYALERLDESGERPRFEEAHARYVARLAERVGPRLLGPDGEASLHRLDHEQHNVRAAVRWSLESDDPSVGMRILGATWRWFQQRAHLREARDLLARMLAAPVADPRTRIAALAAEGSLAYWSDDIPAARSAYDERLSLATTVGDPVLLADAHYDLGFVGMVSGDIAALEDHEHQALTLYEAAGDADGVIRARQGLVLAVFHSGDYARARALEEENLGAFRGARATFQIADSRTFLGGVLLQLGDPAAAWRSMQEGLRTYVTNDNASGLARSLGMAAIIQVVAGDPEFGARIAGATYRIVREKGVMLAPVKVLRLPDPGTVAVEKLGRERADALLAVGDATPVEEMAAEVLAAEPPALTG